MRGSQEKRGGGKPIRVGPSVCFGAELRPLARHGLETGLDASDGAARVARLALQEIEAGVFLQDGLGGATCVARHILLCE